MSKDVSKYIVEALEEGHVQILWSKFEEEITDKGIFVKEKEHWEDSELTFIKANMVFLCTGPTTHVLLNF